VKRLLANGTQLFSLCRFEDLVRYPEVLVEIGDLFAAFRTGIPGLGVVDDVG